MMMARLSLLHSLPRLASVAPFLCLMVAQWECPDMAPPWILAVGAPARAAPLIMARPAAAESQKSFVASVLGVVVQELELVLDLFILRVHFPALLGLEQGDGF